MRRQCLLDTNILILYVVGLTSIAYISGHRKLRDFQEIDFELLRILIDDETSELVLTQHIVAETSNHLDNPITPEGREIFATFQKLVGVLAEHSITSKVAAERPEAIRLGIPDCSAIELAASNVLVITKDLKLYLACSALDYPVINFNHIQERYS